MGTVRYVPEREHRRGAAPAQMEEFRRGFGAGYGSHADEALDKALQQANEQPTTPNDTPSKEFQPRY